MEPLLRATAPRDSATVSSRRLRLEYPGRAKGRKIRSGDGRHSGFPATWHAWDACEALGFPHLESLKPQKPKRAIASCWHDYTFRGWGRTKTDANPIEKVEYVGSPWLTTGNGLEDLRHRYDRNDGVMVVQKSANPVLGVFSRGRPVPILCKEC